MLRIHSFAPIADLNAQVLILGSMPGIESLRQGEYYAHPRNHFWRLIGLMFEFNPALPYVERVQALMSSRIAVWDVLQSCTRQGSLDADIDKSSIVPNDFQSFFARHANITHVFFNGTTAEQIYRSKVLPTLDAPQLEYTRLPSSSPANASIAYERKIEAWRGILLLAAKAS